MMSKAAGAALITGASSGIGAAYADRLAARGHDLILLARREDRLEELAQAIHGQYRVRTQVVPVDFAEEAGLVRAIKLVEAAEGLTMLVNCAGSGALGPASAVDPAAVLSMLTVNVEALTALSLVAARRFSAGGDGTIVNISSILAAMNAPGAAAYGGSKAYVLAFTQSLQAEVAHSGVLVQAVLPGPVSSEFFGSAKPPFPEDMFITAEALVDAALSALDQRESITFPTLPDLDAWRRYEEARAGLGGELTRTNAIASRYHSVVHAGA